MATRRSKTTTRPKARLGRPPKEAGDVAEHTVAVRFTSAGKAVLETLLESERARVTAQGAMPEDAARMSAAHLLRALVYQEAQRRGLVTEGTPGE